MKRQPKQSPLHAARKAAAKELDLPIGHWRVISMAGWLVQYDALHAKLALHGTVDTDEMIKVEAQLNLARGSKPKPAQRIDVTLAGYAHICEACGHTKYTDKDDVGELPKRPQPELVSSGPAHKTPLPRKANQRPRLLLQTTSYSCPKRSRSAVSMMVRIRS